VPEGGQFFESEVRRVHALVMAELSPADVDRAETRFRDAARCAQDYRLPLFERRCLVSLAQFLSSAGRRDAAVESRLAELSHLDHLDRRVARAMQDFRHA
ncbi:MAG TPA: hypothetical protein VF653_02990, partial [Methylomirabilota bacterium]